MEFNELYLKNLACRVGITIFTGFQETIYIDTQSNVHTQKILDKISLIQS